MDTNCRKWTVFGPARAFVCSMIAISWALDGAAQTGTLSFVDEVAGRNSGRSLAISEDGRHLYMKVAPGTGSPDPDGIIVYERNPATGALTEVQEIVSGQGGVSGTTGSSEIVIAPGGEHVYVGGPTEDTIALFTRDADTGFLSFVTDVVDGIGAINGAAALELSPDGANLYTVSSASEEVTVLARNAPDGTLSLVEIVDNDTPGVSGLVNAYISVISPDGGNLYVLTASFAKGSAENSRLTVFDRNASDGTLTYNSEVEATDGRFLWADISADGRHVYVANDINSGSSAVVVFSRDLVTGALSLLEQATLDDDPAYVVLSPDGLNVYAAPNLTTLTRDPNTGLLTPGSTILDRADTVLAASPDGAHLYTMYRTVSTNIFENLAIYNRHLAVNGMGVAGAGFYEAGETVSLSIVGAVDESRPIQWRKDGVNLMDGGHISGSATPNLVITALESSDQGFYTALYDDGSKAATAIGPAFVSVVAVGALSLSAFLVPIVLAMLCALGVYRVCKWT